MVPGTPRRAAENARVGEGTDKIRINRAPVLTL
jgi:hypothetical protein